MSKRLSRRAFIKRTAAASGAFAVGLDTSANSWVTFPLTRQKPLADLPRLDGQLLFDNTSCDAASLDWGRNVRRKPLAVMKADSVKDVVRVVQYANKHHLQIAMRGQGHCVNGQAQAGAGIVIDSSRLSSVSWYGDNMLDARPGALWGEVARIALAKGLTPPVMTDAMMLSVGGTLSAGGTGETSYRYGAQVDHVLELDVVTGAGKLVTCSPERNKELFHMILAGLGQCGIIVRARLRLTKAPEFIALYRLSYADPNMLLADQASLASVKGVDLLAGEVMKEADGSLRFSLFSGIFLEQTGKVVAPRWLADLQFKSEDHNRTSYWDYLDRRSASIAASKVNGKPNPSIAMMLPQRAVAPFLEHVLSTPEAFVGIWRIEVFPMLTARFRQPLHKIPDGPIAYTLRLQRRASAQHAPDHVAMLRANESLMPRLKAAGGKIYPPFSPLQSNDDWREHYGPETWQRLVVAKKRFDPNNVLTPGPGIFS